MRRRRSSCTIIRGTPGHFRFPPSWCSVRDDVKPLFLPWSDGKGMDGGWRMRIDWYEHCTNVCLDCHLIVHAKLRLDIVERDTDYWTMTAIMLSDISTTGMTPMTRSIWSVNNSHLTCPDQTPGDLYDFMIYYIHCLALLLPPSPDCPDWWQD